jgi:hypothetical protein
MQLPSEPCSNSDDVIVLQQLEANELVVETQSDSMQGSVPVPATRNGSILMIIFWKLLPVGVSIALAK